MRYVCLSLVKILTIFIVLQNITSCARLKNEPLYLYASQKGKQTLDNDENGGNPFASAIVELLAHKALVFKEFRTALINLTQVKSERLQMPEIPDVPDLETWQLLPKNVSEKRVALVLVFSNYSVAELIHSLPGAKHDMYRIAAALNKAGFEVQTVIDPDSEQVEATLEEFAKRSSTSDIAVLYTTGHGVEVNGVTYLLPGDYPFSMGSLALKERAIHLKRLGKALHAGRANLLFYGGCRNNPFDKQ